MDLDTAAKCLAELGHPTRLAAFRLLVRAGEEGLLVGELQGRLDVPASTLAHHLVHLVSAGLVSQQRTGRICRCRPNFPQMKALIGFLTAQCCEGLEPEIMLAQLAGAPACRTA